MVHPAPRVPCPLRTSVKKILPSVLHIYLPVPSSNTTSPSSSYSSCIPMQFQKSIGPSGGSIHTSDTPPHCLLSEAQQLLLLGRYFAEQTPFFIFFSS